MIDLSMCSHLIFYRKTDRKATWKWNQTSSHRAFSVLSLMVCKNITYKCGKEVIKRHWNLKHTHICVQAKIIILKKCIQSCISHIFIHIYTRKTITIRIQSNDYDDDFDEWMFRYQLQVEMRYNPSDWEDPIGTRKSTKSEWNHGNC
jgi:hypothetical protein